MHHSTLDLEPGFAPVLSLRGVQVAQMTLAPGEHTGGPANRHAGADQWLYVVAGAGRAIVDGNEQALRPGSLLVIERGEAHEIRCSGEAPLRTLSVYSPPAYDAQGDRLPAGKG